MHRLVPALDEKDQEVEIARDQRLLAPRAHEHPAARREHEIAEAKAGHGPVIMNYRDSGVKVGLEES
jgi:hypothetical protein